MQLATGHIIWLPTFQTYVTLITRWLFYGNNKNTNSKYSTAAFTSVLEILGIVATGIKQSRTKCGQKWLAHNTVIIISVKLHALVTAKSIRSAKREDRLLRNLKLCQVHGITLAPRPLQSRLKLKFLHAIYPYRLHGQHAIPWPSVLKKGGQRDPNQLP